MADPYLIVVRNGPTWNLDSLVVLAEVLSEKYSGEIWTFAYNNSPETRVVGSFRITRERLSLRWGAASKLLRVFRLVFKGSVLRWRHGHRLVVITYDPLLNGVVGVALKYLAGARFVCEVNGVYDDPNNLVDLTDKRTAKRKMRAMIRVSSLVLSRADQIKLLFPQQLDGYKRIPPHVPRAAFSNLVDSRHFRFREAEPEAVLLFIGYPFYRKGVDLLLKAFSRILPDFPNWRLVVVGFRLEEEATKQGLPADSVEFLRPQPPEVISQLLERCSALVLPSRSEAMGRVLIEAAMKGRARIGSRVGGIPHYVSDNVDGLLFESGDVEDLVSTLRGFLSDEEAPRRLGDAALARARSEHSPEAYLEAFSQMVSGPGTALA